MNIDENEFDPTEDPTNGLLPETVFPEDEVEAPSQEPEDLGLDDEEDEEEDYRDDNHQ